MEAVVNTNSHNRNYPLREGEYSVSAYPMQFLVSHFKNFLVKYMNKINKQQKITVYAKDSHALNIH